ncbi:MAG: B12-binding domain-containing radical SAM protein [Deltaproteobacteria bacterium]|nr:B12-binding domain-containing radical SAM protein [Deltaproteobacteria bacterium]
MRWLAPRDDLDSMRRAPTLPTPIPQAPRTGTVLLVNPFYDKDPHASFGKHVLTPSLALTSIAAATPPGWEVAFWDENLLQGAPPTDIVPEVVGITVHLTFAKRAYELARWFRARGSVVVLGGLHVLSCPDEVASHADAIAIGNGVPLWPRILDDVRRGCLKMRYQAPYVDFRSEPVPDRSILPEWGFLTPLSLIATRGCHNRCDFCYLATGDARVKYQMRDVADVAVEFRESGEPYGVFVDNNLGSSKRYLRQLCHALAPLERIWSAAVTLDVTDDPVLVREMALAGCTGVFVGFESLNDDNLRDAGKRTPIADEYARRVALFHDNGIHVNGSFVLGFDHDRPDVFERTLSWVEDNRLECATYHILTPYPNTPLFRRMEAEGRLLHHDWERYDTAHCVFQPRHMASEALEAGYGWLYEQTFSHASIWSRRPAQLATIPPYLATAYLYKRSNRLWPELIRRQLVHRVWAPLVEQTRRRHVRFRKRLARGDAGRVPVFQPFRAGV